MNEEITEVLGNAYDIIQELEETINMLTKDKPTELSVRARARFVLSQINDVLYENL